MAKESGSSGNDRSASRSESRQPPLGEEALDAANPQEQAHGQPTIATALEKRVRSLESQLAATDESRGDDKDDPCGCREPCGCKKKSSCCIELYISGLQFLKNSGVDGNMEIIVAVKAGDTWGLLPSLVSYVLLDKKVSDLVPFHSVITRMCVECGACKEIPLTANVLEVVQKGGKLEGRPESGSAESRIMVSCACPTTSAFLTVPFAKKEGGDIRGLVGVEISSRLYPGGCC